MMPSACHKKDGTFALFSENGRNNGQIRKVRSCEMLKVLYNLIINEHAATNLQHKGDWLDKRHLA